MRLALYTTIYPEALPFLQQWGESVTAQSWRNFDLWIALDEVAKVDVFAATGCLEDAHFITVPPSSTPAEVRNYALNCFLDHCDAVVLVDSDDILLPIRMEAASVAAKKNDLTVSAMELADASGAKLDILFNPALEGKDIVRGNVFGFSNTTWRSSVLKACLPVPSECRLMDWMVAVKAHLAGASIGFDSTPSMLYRQHAGNMALLLPPFSPEQIMTATQLVLGHYRLLEKEVLPRHPGLESPFLHAYEEVSLFFDVMSAEPELLNSYAAALNQVSFRPVWWSCVAHPNLEHVWKT